MNAAVLALAFAGLVALVVVGVLLLNSTTRHLPAYEETGGQGGTVVPAGPGQGGQGMPAGPSGSTYGAMLVNDDGSLTPYDPYSTPSAAEAEANRRKNAGPFFQKHYNDAVQMLRSKNVDGEVLVLRWNPDMDAPPVNVPVTTTVLHVDDAGIVENAQPKGAAWVAHGTLVARITL